MLQVEPGWCIGTPAHAGDSRESYSSRTLGQVNRTPTHIRDSCESCVEADPRISAGDRPPRHIRCVQGGIHRCEHHREPGRYIVIRHPVEPKVTRSCISTSVRGVRYGRRRRLGGRTSDGESSGINNAPPPRSGFVQQRDRRSERWERARAAFRTKGRDSDRSRLLPRGSGAVPARTSPTLSESAHASAASSCASPAP